MLPLLGAYRLGWVTFRIPLLLTAVATTYLFIQTFHTSPTLLHLNTAQKRTFSYRPSTLYRCCSTCDCRHPWFSWLLCHYKTYKCFYCYHYYYLAKKPWARCQEEHRRWQ